MPKLRTLIASVYQSSKTPAAGLHDPARQRTYMFYDFVTPKAKPMKTLTVGRDKCCDICVQEGHASRVHLKLERRTDGAMLLTDMESTNGIVVDGELVTEPVLLLYGMRIRIGEAYLYAVDRDKKFPIQARTLDDVMREAARIYGNNALAARRIGVSRETVRRRVTGPFGVSA